MWIGVLVIVAIVGCIVALVCAWILDCEEEDRRLGRKPRTNFWLR